LIGCNTRLYVQSLYYMTNSELKQRTKQFALRCIQLSFALPETVLGKYLSSQLTRSTPSCAANYRAACLAQSKNDFASKISIVLEEADESAFWIEIINDERLISIEKLVLIQQEAAELTKIFAASRITVRKNAKKTEKEPNK